MLLVIAKQQYITKKPKAEQNHAESTQVSPNTSMLAVADRGASLKEPTNQIPQRRNNPKTNAEKRRKQNRTQKFSFKIPALNQPRKIQMNSCMIKDYHKRNIHKRKLMYR